MTLTKEMFLNHLYGGMDEPDLKIIDVFICKLRKKLAQATGGDHYIETVWGRGYVLRDAERLWQSCAGPDGRSRGTSAAMRNPPGRSLIDKDAALRRREQAGEIGGDSPGRKLGRVGRPRQRGARFGG